MRPSGSDNYLKWRRSIDEHLELRRLSWDEYAMFNWLCTKASPHTGTLRTSWPTLAEQTGLSPKHVEKLCRGLKKKRYIWYPKHQGRRGRLVELAIHKFPLSDNTYTDISALCEEVPLKVQTKVLAKVPAKVGPQLVENTRDSWPPKREIENNTLRVREADQRVGLKRYSLLPEEAIRKAPPAMRETLEFFFMKTGIEEIDELDLQYLFLLDQAHTPAAIQKAISRALDRFSRNGRAPAHLTFKYLWETLKRYTTLRFKKGKCHERTSLEDKYQDRPDGLIKL